MDARTDRRLIEPLLKAHFPTLVGKKSDEWHGFLNAETGLNISLDEPNSTAFDKWRVALSDKGFPVWGVSAERMAAIATRAAELKQAEDLRRANETSLLQTLGKEAPLVTAESLLK
jgi:hypothetical protein